MAGKRGKLKYPSAYIAEGAGDLMQVTDWTFDFNNKGKAIHTLRMPGAGASKGKPEGTVSFNFAIDEEGLERDYIARVREGSFHEIRCKLPGGLTMNLNGMYTSFKLNAPLEDATTGSASFLVLGVG